MKRLALLFVLLLGLAFLATPAAATLIYSGSGPSRSSPAAVEAWLGDKLVSLEYWESNQFLSDPGLGLTQYEGNLSALDPKLLGTDWSILVAKRNNTWQIYANESIAAVLLTAGKDISAIYGVPEPYLPLLLGTALILLALLGRRKVRGMH